MSAPSFEDLSPGVVVEGPILPEPVEILTTVRMGTSIKLVGKGLHTGQVRDPILDVAQLAQLTLTPKDLPFDGDPQHFKLGVEAARLGLAYEYDPYFSLSIARVDPLPHQLEAVYEYFLKLPRIRFLLADDPGSAAEVDELLHEGPLALCHCRRSQAHPDGRGRSTRRRGHEQGRGDQGRPARAGHG